MGIELREDGNQKRRARTCKGSPLNFRPRLLCRYFETNRAEKCSELIDRIIQKLLFRSPPSAACITRSRARRGMAQSFEQWYEMKKIKRGRIEVGSRISPVVFDGDQEVVLKRIQVLRQRNAFLRNPIKRPERGRVIALRILGQKLTKVAPHDLRSTFEEVHLILDIQSERLDELPEFHSRNGRRWSNASQTEGATISLKMDLAVAGFSR